MVIGGQFFKFLLVDFFENLRLLALLAIINYNGDHYIDDAHVKVALEKLLLVRKNNFSTRFAGTLENFERNSTWQDSFERSKKIMSNEQFFSHFQSHRCLLTCCKV